MNNYQRFIFDSYEWNVDEKTLLLHYAIDDALHFTETYRFNFAFNDYDSDALESACQALFFMAGVSYYKTYLPANIVIATGQLTEVDADFFSRTYQRGLGEFFYVNQLDPITPITFPFTPELAATSTAVDSSGLLIGVGGGKDSLVSIEALRAQPGVMTWSLDHQAQLQPLVDRIGLPHAWVDREWDSQLLTLNQQGAYNGHIPISAIFACVGTVVAILTGCRDIIVSNEQAANEPTLTYHGIDINHQYSKSEMFEQDYQAYLTRHFGTTLRYYSFLRPLNELRIAQLFAQTAFSKYKDVFSSCNRAFIHSSDHMSWCGVCPKCAFVFLALTPFIDRLELEALWSGKNLLLDQTLRETYEQLLGTAGDKPLECVGEIKESRAAMRLAQKLYPALTNYDFYLPATYDYTTLGTTSMPPEMYEQLLIHLSSVVS
jgi:hypothetical protein